MKQSGSECICSNPVYDTPGAVCCSPNNILSVAGANLRNCAHALIVRLLGLYHVILLSMRKYFSKHIWTCAYTRSSAKQYIEPLGRRTRLTSANTPPIQSI